MKRSLFLVSLIGLISGCSLFKFSDNAVYVFSNSVGKATGLVCSASKLDKNVLCTINNIFDRLSEVIPDKDEEFSTVWNMKFMEEMTKLKESGKINENIEPILNNIFSKVLQGFEYILDKHKDWKNNATKLSCMISGFINGFNEVTKLYSGELVCVEMDPVMFEAYHYLSTKNE